MKRPKADTAPVLLWFHRDLRLGDQPAVAAAVATGRPVVPLFVLDDETPGRWATGGAQRWWLHHSLAALDTDLRSRGTGLVLRRGRWAVCVPRMVAETGAAEIHAGQPTEPWARAAMDQIRAAVGDRLHLHHTTTLFPPDAIRTRSDRGFLVYSAFARAARARGAPPVPLASSNQFTPYALPRGETLEAWRLQPEAPDWSGGLRATWTPGEAEAQRKLGRVVAEVVPDYANSRDFPGQPGTSMLSPHLHWGEISAGAVWHAIASMGETAGATAYINEILWREFSKHLLWHHPELPDQPLRREFGGMPWGTDARLLTAWQRGQTGVPIVDAGMRQLWSIGWMHNRVRMIVASYLVKHLMISWKDGEAWFWDTLVDADLGSNSASWQWVAGCGADAAPFFRIFNPVLQGRKFDPDGAYVRRWVPELAKVPRRLLHAPWEAADPPRGYAAPLVDLTEGRQRALAAFRQLSRAAA